MNPDAVDVVLVRPARPANVAAACRAMKNMGLRRLVMVGAPQGLERPEVRGLAYGAWDVLDGAVHAGSLLEAVAESSLVVGTSSRAAADSWTPRWLAAEGAARAGAGRTSLVFGPESTGLGHDELALCHLRVTIPADREQPSLNLAQAVLILAYEIRLSAAHPAAVAEGERAVAGDLEGALASLREALVGIGYLNRDNPDAILAEVRSLVARAGPTSREVTLLRGIARQILWAAGRIGRGRGGDG